MSEGVPEKDLAAVAQVISGRVHEPGWRQPGFALRSHTRHNGLGSQELADTAALWSLLDETGCWLGRGRDRHCWRPPAQIPASGITALGSCYEYLAANRLSGHGCLILAGGR